MEKIYRKSLKQIIDLSFTFRLILFCSDNIRISYVQWSEWPQKNIVCLL